MNDNVSCGEIRFIEDAGFWVGCLRERELHGIAAAFENIAKERDSLRARVAELERELNAIRKDCDRYKAWCAGVMAQESVSVCTTKSGDLMMIERPQPLKENE